MDQSFLDQTQAFPAGSGPKDRTTYMFTYVDPQPACPKLEELLEAYWDLMPKYQVSSQSTSQVNKACYNIVGVLYG